MTVRLRKKNYPYPHWEYLDNNSSNRLRIVPERGGLITQWNHQGQEILYFDLERFKQSNKSIRGGIPILFPICGNLPGDCFSIPQGEFFLKQHGFARNLPWIMGLLENKDGFYLKLSSNKDTRSQFPYEFIIQIEICPTINSLDFHIFIENLGEEVMPFSFGLHPYFAINDLQKVAFEGLPEKCFDHSKSLVDQTENQLKAIHKGVDFLTEPLGLVSLINLITGRRISLINEPPMNLTVVWSDPPRKMLCIEPWTSPRMALISGERRIMLTSKTREKLKCKFVLE